MGEQDIGKDDQSAQSEIPNVIAFAQKLLDASLDVIGAADGIGAKAPRDPDVVTLTILCRSISNLHAIMVLLQNQGVVEARALVRLMYENVLWIGGLNERGSEFVKDMLDDEAYNRKQLAQLTFRLDAQSGGDGRSEDSLHLRTLISEMDKQFPKGRKLNAAKTAASASIETLYFEYSRFSLDAVHCSVTALGRHISGRDVENGREFDISVVPNTPPREVLSTILGGCRAMILAMVGANDLLGGLVERQNFLPMVEEFERDHNGSDL